VDEGGGAQVFLIWRAPASGYATATDTFIFNPEGKILRQNVVVHYQGGSVQDSWDNHFAAFGGQDVERILLDYTEDSVIAVYDQTSGEQTVFAGLSGVRECFTGLFARLSDTSDLSAPVIDVHEAADDQPGSVLLIWRCPASGYAEATDTFIFDSNSKIIRQNVVVTDTQSSNDAYPVSSEEATGSGPVHDGWSNHFAAFGGQNVEQILADYTESSVITVYNQVSGEKSVFEGLSGAQTCFEGLFASLHDTSDLGAPIIHVDEGGGAQVFLIWRAPASGYTTATDTFIFNPEGKILRQNVVVHYEPIAEPEAGLYHLVHDGHCASGWISGSNTLQDDIESCHIHCSANANCGYFAFADDNGSNTNCALYTAIGGCADDDEFGNYNAYQMD